MKTNDLKELVTARPDLEITPFVSEDVTCPDYRWSVGYARNCSIDKIATSSIDDERLLIYSEDEDDFLDAYLCHGEDESLSDDEVYEKAKEEYENLPWEETILLYIDV